MLVETPPSSVIIQTLTELHTDFDEAYTEAMATQDRYLLCIAAAHGNAFAVYKSYVDTDRVYDFMAIRN